MKLSELTTGAAGLKAGTEVFDKHGLNAGVTLPEAEVKFLEKKEAEAEAQRQKNLDYEKKRVLERAKEYGLVLKDVE